MLVLLLFGGLSPSALATSGSAEPAANAVSAIAPFPNFATALDAQEEASLPSGQNGNWSSQYTYLITDSQNHLAFELTSGDTEPGACTSASSGSQEIVKYDLESAQRLLTRCVSVYPSGQSVGYTYSKANWAVVDPQSRVIFFPEFSVAGGPGLSRLTAISEDSLTPVAHVCLGPPSSGTAIGYCDSPQLGAGYSQTSLPYPFVHGVSWYSPTNDLVVLTDADFPTQDTGPTAHQTGATITDYHVESTTTGVHLTLQWVITLSPNLCPQALPVPTDTARYQIGGVYLSENPDDPAVFAACDFGELAAQISGPTTAGVVKVALQKKCMCPASAPPESVVVSPAPSPGFLFDPVGERGYLLPSLAQNQTGPTVLVYDGRNAGAIIGRFDVDSHPVTSQSALLFAVDPATGRFYGEDATYGLRIVDGRRTPVNPGYFAPLPAPVQFAPSALSLSVVAPGGSHDYVRLYISLLTSYTRNSGHIDYFTGVADRLPITTDPPPSEVDANTYNGAVPPGSLVSATYGTNAAGYGVHSDLVGGYAALWYNNNPYANNTPFLNFPEGHDQLDLALGAVGATTLRDGTAQAQASALYDVNGQASKVYAKCTDAYSAQNCVPPHCDISSETHQQGQDPCAQVVAAALGGSMTSSTAQQWPYLTAECSGGSQEYQGLYSTPSHSTDPNAAPPSPEMISNSPQATGADARVDCDKYTGFARFQCNASAQPQPSAPPYSSGDFGCDPANSWLSVGSATTQTSVAPPAASGSGAAQSSVTTLVSGIHLTTPDGSTIDIGQIKQEATAQAGGRPGTAHTTRRVTLSHIVVTKADGEQQTLCESTCVEGGGIASVLDTLNSLDPSHLQVSFPTPDEPFSTEPDGVSPAGSPGGYQAVVQANLTQQQGDRLFNAMTGFNGAEASFLPALRIVLYDPGLATISREVLDFAGVEADAETALQVTPPFNADTPNLTQAMVDAGLPLIPLPPTDQTGGPGPSPTSGSQTAGTSNGGLLGVAERVLTGLSSLVRSPAAAMQMAAFLVLLGAPLVLMRRRWTWRSR